MERDFEEWRRPWTDAEVDATADLGETLDTEAHEPVRPRPLPPPATWDVDDSGPGSPAGSVRPPDTVGTVDAPPRDSSHRRGRGIGTAVLVGLLGAIVGTAGTIAVLGTDTTGRGGIAGQPPVQAPTINVEDAGNEVVPAVARAVLPSVVRVDVVGSAAGGAEQQLGLGSGVIYRSDGYIITNNHVVQEAPGLDIRLSDGEVYRAELIGTDPRNDLAVLKIDATGLPAINLRTEDQPVVGEMAVAIGSPFGLDASVTAGIISATGRDITVPEGDGSASVIAAVIQTDAAINPGNSGGALVDRQGRLLGINTAILTGSGGSQGVGFAIPVAQAITSADQLIETGEVQYPLMGVRGSDVNAEMADRLGLEDRAGALIEDVTPGSGAEDAGLRPQDVITAVEGEPIESMTDLVVAIRSFRPGDSVEVTYLRDGEETTVSVTLGELEDEEG